MALDQSRIRDIARDYTAAWNSGSPAAVSSFFAKEGSIAINRSEPYVGRVRVADMAAGFYADIPDLSLVCDAVRCAGDHVVYCWTFTGTHARTNSSVRVSGWEEWDLDADYKVRSSRGWYDADDYARQVGEANP